MTEPDRLLEEFRSFLNDDGGILSEFVPQLIQLMQSTNGKLVPKCISLYIIASSAPEIQLKLCEEGAWDILLKWLQETLKQDNHAFLLELLNVYLCLPVRLEHLTQNVCPKLINSLTKRCEHEAVRNVAINIVKKWKEIISADSKRVDHSEIKKKKEVKPEEQSPVNSLKQEKTRKRTVKMPPTVMRTAGIEDEPDTHPRSRCEVLAKKSKMDTDTKPASERPIEAFHQKITVTPTEPRKVVAEMHESPDFINALTTMACPVVRKKRKLPVKSEVPIASESAQVKVGDTGDSLEEDRNDPSESSPLPTGMGAIKSSLTSLASCFSVDTKPKKRVSWADEDKLQSFFYFELDESERVNVNRVSCEDIRRKEMSMERQLFRKGSDDAGVGNLKWYTPPPLERLFLIEPGFKSVERQVQTERERYVLQAIYFSRESIPPSPEEPDPEVVEPGTPVEIPLDDLTVQDSTTSDGQFNSEKLLVVKDTQMSLNPEVADLVKSLAANFSNGPADIASPVPSSARVKPNGPLLVDVPPVASKPPLLNGVPKSEISAPVNQSLQRELWDVLEENYPEVKVHELSAERIRDLLEPLREQLVARGIFQLPSYENCTPPLPQSPPPRPNMNYSVRPNSHPNYPGPPPLLPPQREFRPPPRNSLPLQGGFRPAMPRPPRYIPPGPPPSQYPCGPLLGGPNPPHRGGGGGPYVRGGLRGRPTQPCKFFQQGLCRNGHSCTFLHAKR